MKIVKRKVDNVVLFQFADSDSIDINGHLTVVSATGHKTRVNRINSADHEVVAGVPELTAFEGGQFKYDGSWKTLNDKSPVPAEVSAMRARIALHNAGLLTSVQFYMDDPDTDPLHKLAWDFASSYERSSPTIAAVQAELELSESQLDDLFRAARDLLI